MTDHIRIVTTGGTIASRVGDDGAARAADGGRVLLERLEDTAGVEIEIDDVLSVNSFALDLGSMARVVAAVEAALADPRTTGVVVTHGTDTMEETAFMVDLLVADDRPIVFTGAQRSGDSLSSDGPMNLRDAITVATSPAARGRGAMIGFDGAVWGARGTRKQHTLRSGAFGNATHGPIGVIAAGELRPAAPASPTAPRVLGVDLERLSRIRVDVAPYYPGADTASLDAFASAGADAIVVEGTGAGNANPAWTERIGQLVGQGLLVALTSRVQAGPVTPIYGGGGGVDLIAAGAHGMGSTTTPQARILLAALLARHGSAAAAAAHLPHLIDG